MINTLPDNATGATGPSPRVIAHLKQLARSVRPSSSSCVRGNAENPRELAFAFRMPLDNN